MNNRSRKGFVLPLTLLLVGVAAIIVGSVVGYVTNVSSFTREALARDRCRFAAQSAIEQAKIDVQEGFSNYIAANFSSIQIAPRKAQAFNWFNEDNVCNGRRTIGSPSSVTIFDGQTMPVEVNDCRVWVGIGNSIEHENGESTVVVPFVATAEYEHPDGRITSVTIGEWLIFGTEQSQVFDNAYFVNNYGWMSGNFTINGEFRANGNVSLTGGAVVNGSIYAAPNPEIGAAGTASITSSSIYNQSRYRSSAGARARYDTGNLNETGSYDAAKSSGTISAAVYDSDGNLTGGSMTAGEAPKAIVHQTQTIAGETSSVDPVEMPFVSDLAPYIEYAKAYEGGKDEEGNIIYKTGQLTYPSVNYTDGTGESHTAAGGTVNAYNPLSAAGPSGDAALADAGSLLLVGTQSNPIRIDGPVVVAGDVIIKGYVTGQGTIYAGRNIHIIGDIKYVNAPSWDHYADYVTATNEMARNETKDLLGLVAKGNIVIGNSADSSIAANVNSGSDIAYSCDESDSQIGYPSKAYSSTQTTTTRTRWGSSTSTTTSNTFTGDYAGTEQINALSTTLASSAPGGYDSSSGKFGKVRTETVTLDTYTTVPVYNRWGQQTGTKKVYDTKKTLYTSYDRHYYETICDDAIISSLRATVSQIDAVMYNNHGVFGSLGANFAINGALVCRDEGLTANGGTFNWDMRLRRKKDSEVVSKLGLPKGAGDPYTCRWQELPDSENPVYRAAKGAEQ